MVLCIYYYYCHQIPRKGTFVFPAIELVFLNPKTQPSKLQVSPGSTHLADSCKNKYIKQTKILRKLKAISTDKQLSESVGNRYRDSHGGRNVISERLLAHPTLNPTSSRFTLR